MLLFQLFYNACNGVLFSGLYPFNNIKIHSWYIKLTQAVPCENLNFHRF